MKCKKGIRIIFLALVFFWGIIIFPTQYIYAQDPLKDLRVTGNSVQFIFNTLDQYKNGIEIDGWSRIKIRYLYTGHNAWKLSVWTNDPEIVYEGDPINNIPVGNLELTVQEISNNDPTTTYTTPFTLSNIKTTFAQGNGLVPPTIVELEFTITYKLGTPPNIMLNKPSGFYYVALQFLLEEQI
ncbi:MAG: hypothetical protein AB7S48_15130 [Bacteroidales bacterium]